MRSSSAFTLIEVLIATAILATTAAGVATLVTLSAASTASAREQTQAMLLAVDELEHLRALPWTFDAGGAPVSDGGLMSSTDQVGPYVRRWTVEPLPADPAHTLILQVRVRPIARGHEVVLTSVLTRKGT